MSALRTCREQLALSQIELAQLAGVSQQLISHLETGRRDAAELGLERARAIVAALRNAGASWTLDDVFPREVQ